ncbi:C-C motif chemokine 19-like [Anolis sagrei]|uniref:C-C motif chemokine 19-like n=1 Tax=Anolis sagrei TaxID=38937 RepID=UPI00295B90EE|nr:C-C motif chemokine 19-like [Anolis sagrei ordinatus]
MGILCQSQGLLCLLALSTWTISPVSEGRQAMDCCVRTSPIPIPAKIVRSYRDQHAEEGCFLRAVVFTTFRRKHLCAPPDAWWVDDLKAKLDQRKARQRAAWTSYSHRLASMKDHQ